MIAAAYLLGNSRSTRQSKPGWGFQPIYCKQRCTSFSSNGYSSVLWGCEHDMSFLQQPSAANITTSLQVDFLICLKNIILYISNFSNQTKITQQLSNIIHHELLKSNKNHTTIIKHHSPWLSFATANRHRDQVRSQGIGPDSTSKSPDFTTQVPSSSGE